MYKRGGVWRINIRHNGRRIQKSLGTGNRKLAEKIEAKIKTQFAEGTYFEKPVGAKKTVVEMMEKFVEEHAPKVSRKMQISYRTSINNLLPFFGNRYLTEVSPKEITRYKQKRLMQGRKPATVNREIACLSKAFSVAMKEWEWIKENPVTRVPRERENNVRIRWLTSDEERSLCIQCREWLKDIVVFAINTGMRKDEILSLKWHQVNIFRKEAVILETKNHEPRTVPLNAITMEIIKRKSKVRTIGVDYIFPNSVGRKISGRNLTRAFSSTIRKVGISDFRFHDLRHTFATRMVQAGIDLYTVQKLLGQKTSSVTMRYAHHNTASLRRGVDTLVGCNLASPGNSENLNEG